MPGHALILHPTVGGRLTLRELASEAKLHPDLIEHFIACGLLEPVYVEDLAAWFDRRAVGRLRTICRLRDDLGINLAGIAVVLNLLERMSSRKGKDR